MEMSLHLLRMQAYFCFISVIIEEICLNRLIREGGTSFDHFDHHIITHLAVLLRQ